MNVLFPPTSRYFSVETTTLEERGGKVIVYLRRRFVPQPERFALLQEHVVKQGDRLTTSPRNTWTTRSSSGASATRTARCDRTS